MGMRTESSLPKFPPVFVMNPYYTGVGITRSLRRKGPAVYGLASEKDAPGCKSRLYDGVYEIPNGRDEPEALYQRLLEIREQHDLAPVIFPTRDFDVLFLHRYREQLGPFYKLPQPGGSAVLRLLDKLELADIAIRHSIPVPKTVICACLDEIEREVQSLSFPVIVKPRFAYQWRKEGVWEKVGARKAVLLSSMEQVRTEYRRLESITTEVLLQEYIQGDDTDVVVCCCYVGKNGQLLGYYTAKKLRQNPPLLGTACMVELADLPAIVTPSMRLLAACEYVGMAEVEYKHDRFSDKYFLIEVNPRHWDQHELGNLARVNLTWLAYQDIIGCHPAPQMPAYDESTRCTWIAEREALFLLMRNIYVEIISICRAGIRMEGRSVVKSLNVFKNGFLELADILSGTKMFAILKVRDPIPGLILMLRIFRELARLLVGYPARLVFRQSHAVAQDN
jgi:D-aspartate ligase